MSNLEKIVSTQYEEYKNTMGNEELPDNINVNILENTANKKLCSFNSTELYTGTYRLNISQGYVSEADENEFKSVLMHEFTHLLDGVIFRDIAGSKKEFDGIMQSYSEINANYEKMKYLFRMYSEVNLSPDLNTVIRDGKHLYSLGDLINETYNDVKNMFDEFDSAHNPEILVNSLRKLFYAIGIEKYINIHCEINFNQDYKIFPSCYREYCEKFRKLSYSEEKIISAKAQGMVFWDLIEYLNQSVQENSDTIQ